MSFEKNHSSVQQAAQKLFKIPPLNIAFAEKKSHTLKLDHESEHYKRNGNYEHQLEISELVSTKSQRSLNRVNRDHLKDFLSVDRKRNVIANKSYRDISHIQDKYKTTANILKLPDLSGMKSATQLLPIHPEHLKKLMISSDKLGVNIASPRGVIDVFGCSKEKCLEKVIKISESNPSFQESLDQYMHRPRQDNPTIQPKSPQPKYIDTILTTQKKSVEQDDPFIYLGSPTGRQEVQNLKEWFNYMQDNYLNKLLDHKLIAEMGDEEKNDKFEIADVVLKTGLREIVRQVSVQCVDRGELLSVIVERYLRY